MMPGAYERTPEFRARMSVVKRGRKLSPETRSKMSAVLKGRPKSAEHRANIAKAIRGMVRSPETRSKVAAARWGGDDVGYWAVHRRLRKQRGRPQVCTSCLTTDPNKCYEWACTIPRGYSTDLTKYIRLCKSCHGWYDGNMVAIRAAIS